MKRNIHGFFGCRKVKKNSTFLQALQISIRFLFANINTCREYESSTQVLSSEESSKDDGVASNCKFCDTQGQLRIKVILQEPTFIFLGIPIIEQKRLRRLPILNIMNSATNKIIMRGVRYSSLKLR